MRLVDILVIFVYFLTVIAIGVSLRGRQRNADDYFIARGSFKGFTAVILIGFSIAATLFSGISFVIYASSAYSDGAQIALGIACLPIVWLVLRGWFLPRYLAAGYIHPYEVIERQFGSRMRLLMSSMFIVMRIGWMGVLIYAPAMILMAAAGLPPHWFWPTILAVGFTSTVYTTVGGIRGVIVTDAVQFVVMILGTLFIAFFILHRLPIGWTETVTLLADEGRLRVFDFSLDPTKTLTFWSVIFGLSTVNIGNFIADQMSLQRYLAAGSIKQANRSFAINVVGTFVVIVSLVAVGLLIWVWFRYFPDPNLPATADQVLPYFIASKLPPGLGGLLLAAILAATMSSMTSGINTLAGCITNDFVHHLRPALDGVALLRVGRLVSVAIGVIATIAGGLAGRLGSMLVVSQVIMGLFMAPMLAVMVLAVAQARVRPAGAALALFAGIVAGAAIAISPVGALWVAPVSFLTAISVPWLLGRSPRSVARESH